MCMPSPVSESLWPTTFVGTIHRIPLSSGILIAMAETGASMEVADDNEPKITDANRLVKVESFYRRYAKEPALVRI